MTNHINLFMGLGPSMVKLISLPQYKQMTKTYSARERYSHLLRNWFAKLKMHSRKQRASSSFPQITTSYSFTFHLIMGIEKSCTICLQQAVKISLHF